MHDRYFITGTDTGVGKTLITAALLQWFAARGKRSLGLKPVAAGWLDDRQVNPDVLEIQASSSVPLSAESINPVSLEQPIAPHIAARFAGLDIRAADLARHCHEVCEAEAPEFVAVEGAGGWQVPLNDAETMVDLCIELGFPVILVVGMRLGCLNHSLLTADSILSAGLPLAGWVANRIDAAMPVADENLATLRDRIPAPLIGAVPYLDPLPAAGQVAEFLQPGCLQS